jgi:DNA-binding beta-propeller fold protein YncE
MKLVMVLMMSSLLSVPASAEAPPLDYVAVADDFKLPAGMTFGSTSGVAINSKGNILVLSRGQHPLIELDSKGNYIRSLGQGLYDRPHGLKVDRDGNFIKAWGKKGKGPGEFDIAHSVAIDAKGLVYVADRNNQRIQVFDADGNYVRESRHPGTPCGIVITPDQHIWLAHGHAGQVMKLDLDGKVLGVTGKQGKALGQFGEAHFIAVSPGGDIYVADTLNWRVQKFVKKAP